MLAEKSQDKQCFDCQKRGHIKSDCRNRQREMKKTKGSGKPSVDTKQTTAIRDDEITGAVIEGIPNMASSSHDHVFAVTERPRLGNHVIRWKRLVVFMMTTVVQVPVSTPPEYDVSWILVDSRSAVIARPLTHAQEVHPSPRKSYDRCWHEPQD